MKFSIRKYHKNTYSDLNVYGKSPLIKRLKFYGNYPLETGWTQAIVSEIRQNILQDLTSYIQIFAQGNTYTYYNLKSKEFSKEKAYG